MVPKGWLLNTLGDVVEFINGKAHENTINSSGCFIVVNSKFISSDGCVVKKSDTPLCLAQTHDVLMVMSDVPNGKAIAKCFYVDSDKLYTVNQRVGILRATKIDPLFLYYVVNRNGYYLQFDDGLKQTNLRKDEVLNFPIKLPSLLEQRKIAKILSTWDKTITTTERLLINRQQQKKALMQRLLTGKQRFAGFEGEWKLYQLGDYLEEYKEKSSRNDQYEVLTSSRNGLVKQSEYFADNRITQRENVGFNVIPPGYITYRSRSDDGFFYFNKNCFGFSGIISTYYPVFHFPNGNNDFFLHWFNHNSGIFGAFSVGTSQKVLSLNALRSVNIRIPELKEQQKIASVLSSADAEITTIQNQLDNLKQQKKALMQQLLTGKRRVKVDSPALATQ